MSVSLLVGRPGSGKSYEAVVYHVIPSLKQGRKVVTNLPLNLAHFKAVFGEDIDELLEIREDAYSRDDGVLLPFQDPDDFKTQDWKNESGQGPLFVVDECHRQYASSARSKRDDGLLKDCLEYFSMHRHYGHDVLLVTQSVGKLHKQVRELVQICYRVSKHTAAGSDKTYTQKVLDGAESRAAVMNTNIRRYKSQYFKFYKSHTQSDSAVKEAVAQDVKPLWKQHYFYLGIPLVVFGLVQAFSSFSKSTSSQPAPEVKEVAQIATESVSERPAPVVYEKPKKKSEKHPYHKINFSVSGSKDVSYRDENGVWHFDYDVYFNARPKSNDRYRFTLSIRDLALAGYDVSVINHCLVRLRYEDVFDEYVYCEGYSDEATAPRSTGSVMREAIEENF